MFSQQTIKYNEINLKSNNEKARQKLLKFAHNFDKIYSNL